ncbi:MAG: hypothetical protein ACYDCL_03260 [Myxococcales bacterium]
MRPGLPRGLARRLDRLARAAHAFHRFAHHPLCDRYQGELVRLGRKTRLCRGCLFAALGVPLGVGLGLLWPALGPPGLGLSLLALGLGRFLRPGKLVTRLLPAAGLAAAVSGGPWLALAAAGVALAGWGAYRRRGPNRSPCESCPEWRTVEICSGFRPLLRREAAFRRLSASWIDRACAPAPPAA